MPLAILANKQFYYAVWPLLLRWMNEKTFRDWWSFKITFYGITGSQTIPDYHIEIEDGKPCLKTLGFRFNSLNFTTYMWTSTDDITEKSDIDGDESPIGVVMECCP